MGDELKRATDRPPVEAQPTGDWVVGGDGAGGDVLVRDAGNAVRVRIDAGGDDRVTPGTTTSLATRVTIDGGSAALRLGGADVHGQLTLRRGSGQSTVTLLAADGPMSGLWAGGNGADGWVVLRDHAGRNRLWMDGDSGQVHVFNGSDGPTIRLRGSGGSGWFGGYGDHGDLLLFNAATGAPASENATVWLQGEQGTLVLRSKEGNTRIELRGTSGSGWFGGRGADGDILLFPATQSSPDADNATVWIQGKTGDIILRNADCAEEFDVRVEDGVGPGSVLVLDADGQLGLCRHPYDTRAAGVVSGAAGIRPGIVLGRVPGAEDRLPVALAGKVVCNVDATFGPIRVGSLLTTSPRPGHAMVVSERERAFGAVIGKAMAALDDGVGAVPILVGLQ